MHYLDSDESFIAQVELEVGVSRVVECLAETAETFSEDLVVDGLFVSFLDRKMTDSATSIDARLLLYSGSLSKKISFAADLNDSFDEFALGNLPVIVFIHTKVL